MITDVTVSCRIQARFNTKKLHILPTEFIYFIWISEETTIISLCVLNRYVFRLVHKISKSNYQLCHVRPNEHLGSHWRDFHEI